jgi:hypothetical protein
MKKILPLIIFAFLFIYNISCVHAQCTPDPTCIDTGAAGEFCPTALVAGTVGVPYSQVVTFIPPDSASIGSTTISLCEIKLNSITNLPPGLTYASNPSNGAFMVTSPYTRYCMLISGTPTAAGSYNLNISVTPYTILFSNCISTFQTVIDSTSVTMVINSATAINNSSVNKSKSLNCSQNPYTTSTKIFYYSERQEPIELKIHDMLGNTVYSEKMLAEIGDNTFKFKGTELHSGMYMYSVSNNKTVMVKKLIKNN